MNTNNSFMKQWFDGVEDFLESSGEVARKDFLSCCAKRCSDSYPLALYKEAFSDGRNLPEALKYLANNFDGFDYAVFSDRVELSYSQCGCDLYKEGLITSVNLCQCSEASLLYIWEQIYGKGAVAVTTKKTIIGGNDSCLFEIRILK